MSDRVHGNTFIEMTLHNQHMSRAQELEHDDRVFLPLLRLLPEKDFGDTATPRVVT